MNGGEYFTLLSLAVEGHPLFGSGEFHFAKNAFDRRKDAMTTIVIGPNGSGKSRLLRVLADVFIDLKRRQEGQRFHSPKIGFRYLVRYAIGANEYEVHDASKKIPPMRDQKTIPLSEARLPNGVLAISFLANDAFRFSLSDDEFYNYFGMRSASNSTSTSSGTKRIAAHIATGGDVRLHPLKSVMEKLGVKPSLRLSFRVKRRLKPGIPDSQALHEAVYKDASPASFQSSRSNHYQSMTPTDKQDVIRFLEEKGIESLHYDVPLSGHQREFSKDYPFLKHLMALGFLLSPDIEVTREAKSFPAHESSSGEYNILLTFLKLCLASKSTGLILLDEPEVSLHPNWQVDFMSLLKEALPHRVSSHVIIATHSHFLVSGADPASSSVVSLNRSKTGFSGALLDGSAYGWSAEQVLYRVFGLSTFRNHYMEMELRKLIRFLESSRKGPNPKIDKIIESLSRFIAEPDDPLTLLLNQARKRLDSR